MHWTYWDYEDAPADLVSAILDEMREEAERQSRGA